MEASEMTAPTNGVQRGLVVPLLLLTFETGFIDAASFLGLGHVFTANMTGNVVFLGFGLGGARDLWIAGSLVALASFLVGAGCGGRIVKSGEERTFATVLAIEVFLLANAAIVAALGDANAASTGVVLLALLAAPMGVQNAAVRRVAVPDLTTTVLTLTLTGIAADSSFAGGTNPRLARRVGAVLCMLAGALVGALLLRRGIAWTIGAAAIVDAAALVTWWSSSKPAGAT